jgi:hypothetical protein
MQTSSDLTHAATEYGVDDATLKALISNRLIDPTTCRISALKDWLRQYSINATDLDKWSYAMSVSPDPSCFVPTSDPFPHQVSPMLISSLRGSKKASKQFKALGLYTVAIMQAQGSGVISVIGRTPAGRLLHVDIVRIRTSLSIALGIALYQFVQNIATDTYVPEDEFQEIPAAEIVQTDDDDLEEGMSITEITALQDLLTQRQNEEVLEGEYVETAI